MLHTLLRAFRIYENKCLVLCLLSLQLFTSTAHFFSRTSHLVLFLFTETRFLAQFKLGTTLYSTCCIFILKLSCISFIYHIKKKSNPLCFKKMLQKEYAYCKRKPNNSEEKILYHVSPIFYPCHPK